MLVAKNNDSPYKAACPSMLRRRKPPKRSRMVCIAETSRAHNHSTTLPNAIFVMSCNGYGMQPRLIPSSFPERIVLTTPTFTHHAHAVPGLLHDGRASHNTTCAAYP
eukprot:297923-Amphidinium_carterae.1